MELNNPLEPPRRRRRFGERGQSLVEFALIAPLFFVVIFAVVDFSLGLRAWITITNSAREGARYGAVTCATASASSSDVKQRAVDTSSSLLTTSDVSIANCPGASAESIVVTTSYDYDLITPLGGLMSLLSGGSVPSTISPELQL